MKNSTCVALVLNVAGTFVLAATGDVLAQVGAGATPGTPSMETGKSGSGSQSMGMAQVPAGIGERGTGQTQSTLERSGGEQKRSSTGITQEPSGIGERGTGQTQSTLERAGGEQSRMPQAMAPMPPGE